ADTSAVRRGASAHPKTFWGKAMQARDVMTTSVETVRPDTPVHEVARQMADKRISGMPVVDDSGKLVGMVTEGDLLRRVELGTEQRPGWLQIFTSNAKLADEYVHARGRSAGDVMSHDVVSIEPTAPLTEVVEKMERNRVKRLPVLEGGKLVGIVTRGNLVRALGAAGPRTESVEVDDRRLRDQVLAEFRRLPWGLKAESNVVVTDGVVHLWGAVNTPQEQAALRVAAEGIPGVKRVADHTVLVEAADEGFRPPPIL
ncbi:MAG TPA: CBS domain-containing protein, partial [Acidisphaera sp.]|nr:CBS domain-containing protein [Acidisphaera sp.]